MYLKGKKSQIVQKRCMCGFCYVVYYQIGRKLGDCEETSWNSIKALVIKGHFDVQLTIDGHWKHVNLSI